MTYDDDFEENIPQTATSDNTDKKCPSCGGSLSYSPGDKKLVCDYCGHEEDVGEVKSSKQVVMEIPIEQADEVANTITWGDEKKSVKCKSCGASAIYDSNKISDNCPYCDAPLVTDQNQEKGMAPQGICPFTVDKNEAIKKFKDWLSGLWFAPNDVIKKAVEGDINGIYAPYWSFDSKVSARYTGEYGIDKTYTDSKGNRRKKTDWYPCSGNIRHFFDDYLMQASKKSNADLIKEVEPFDTAHCVPYKPEYVANFIAEQYAIGMRESWETAQEQIRKHDVPDLVRKDIIRGHRANQARVKDVEVKFNENKFKYLLLPLWLSSYRYADNVYHFVVNGQSGKVSGNRPYSAIKIFFAVVLAIIVVGGILYLGSSD